MIRLLLAVLATAGIACLLWIGGEQHRANCLAQSRTGCSVLPWSTGAAKKAEASHVIVDGVIKVNGNVAVRCPGGLGDGLGGGLPAGC